MLRTARQQPFARTLVIIFASSSARLKIGRSSRTERYSARTFLTLEATRRTGNLKAKVDLTQRTNMSKKFKGNELRMHRRRCFLSLRDVGRAVGYKDSIQAGRHERSLSVPPFLIALAYEAMFQRPVAIVFSGFYAAASAAVEANLEELRQELQKEVDSGHASRMTVQKLEWLTSRRSRAETA